jgi:hypothetical protein
MAGRATKTRWPQGFRANAIATTNPKFRPFCSPVDGGKCLSMLMKFSGERCLFS